MALHISIRSINTYSKVIISMAVITAMMTVGIMYVWRAQQDKVSLTHHYMIQSQRNDVENILFHKTALLKSYLYGFMFSDEMADFIRNPSNHWAITNLNSAIANLDINALWVYHGADIVYSANSCADNRLAQMYSFVSSGTIRFDNGCCHFFADSPSGLMEITGVSIYHSFDRDRKYKVVGHYFVGCLWDDHYLASLSRAAGNGTGMLLSKTAAVVTSGRGGSDTIAFAFPLPDSAGNVLTYLDVRRGSAEIRDLYRASHRVLSMFIVAEILLLLFTMFFLLKWNEEIIAHNRLEKEKQQLWMEHIKSEKMASLGKLAGIIAHEIRNPLNTILVFAQSLLRDSGLEAHTEKNLRIIEREATRSRDFMASILSFSKEEKSEMTPCNLNTIVKSVLPILEVNAKDKFVKIQLELDEKLGDSLMNHTQIEEVLINLCDNAVDASPEQGIITISTGNSMANDTPYVWLRVEDKGSGISDDVLKRIFEPFFTTKDKGKGTGLGLPLVSDIVELHNGTIDIDTAPGKGTTFTVKLPAAKH